MKVKITNISAVIFWAVFAVMLSSIVQADEVVGNELIEHQVQGTGIGALMVIDEPFTAVDTIRTWSYYGGAAGKWMTPVLFSRSGDTFTCVGYGTTRTSSGTGIETFAFDLVAGTEAVEPGIYFGWSNKFVELGSSTDAVDMASFEPTWGINYNPAHVNIISLLYNGSPSYVPIAVGNEYVRQATWTNRDYAIRATSYTESPPLDPVYLTGIEGDFNCDGRVNMVDLAIFTENWLIDQQPDNLGLIVSDIITKNPWVDARAFGEGGINESAFLIALQAIGEDERVLYLAPGEWPVSGSLTIPSNVSLKFERGARLNISSGVTVTFEGGLEAGIYQIFDGDGDVLFTFGDKPDQVKEVYPQWWGAVTGDTTDEAVMTQNTKALSAAIYTQKMFLPEGIYKINGSLNGLYYGNIKGSGSFRSVIKASEGTTFAILNNIAGDCVVSDIGFEDGGYGVYLATQNLNGTVITFRSCSFKNHVYAGIGTDDNSNSTLLSILECEFRTSETGMALDVEVDICMVMNTWMQVYSETAIRNRWIMKIFNLVGVPAANNTPTSCWIENHGALYVNASRFGGEGGGRTIIKNYAGLNYTYPVWPWDITLENNVVYSKTHFYEFYDLPNRFTIKNNSGYILKPDMGIYLDPGIPSDTRQYYPTYGLFVNDDNVPAYGPSELLGLIGE